jgi:hypothetical protein
MIQGNAAFKSGDYPTAIGHYTTAILANRSEPTFPSNRAAAYLKLGKYVQSILALVSFVNRFAKIWRRRKGLFDGPRFESFQCEGPIQTWAGKRGLG